MTLKTIFILLPLLTTTAFAADGDVPYRPNYTSPLYDQVIAAEAPVSDLPNWHGYHFWKPGIGATVIPQFNGWTEHLYNVVAGDGTDLLPSIPSRIRYFCPKYPSLDREHRIAFWARLISIMASYESGYDPKQTYLEPHLKVLSSGLLQISHESSQQEVLGCKMINPNKKLGQADLLDPKKNLSCAVHIVNYWIGHDETMVDYKGGSWRGLARYWGVFRHSRIKDNEQSFWDEIQSRQPRWQQEGKKRDLALMQSLHEANVKGLEWGNSDWEARDTSTPHPSLLEDVFGKEESAPLTSILRLINQTSFCYE